MDCSALLTKLLEKSAFDHWVSGFAVCVAGIVALVAFWQYQVNAKKLRLDLYN